MSFTVPQKKQETQKRIFAVFMHICSENWISSKWILQSIIIALRPISHIDIQIFSIFVQRYANNMTWQENKMVFSGMESWNLKSQSTIQIITSDGMFSSTVMHFVMGAMEEIEGDNRLKLKKKCGTWECFQILNSPRPWKWVSILFLTKIFFPATS